MIELSSANSQLVVKSGCNCPGSTLTYECTVAGGPGGFTVWELQGTGFQSSCEVILRHTLSISDERLLVCDNYNTTMIARILGNDSNSFTSELNITFSSDIITEGRLSVMCAYDSGTFTTITGSNSLNNTGMYTNLNESIIIWIIRYRN